MRNKITILLLSVILCGCHTIRPVTTTYDEFIQPVAKMPLEVGLVMDETYRNYVSKDRGDALADSQTYYVGEALLPLTTTYFQSAFEAVQIFDTLPAKKGAINLDYVIAMEILNFDNLISGIIGTEQEIVVTLKANIYDQNLRLIKTQSATDSYEGSIGAFGSTKKSSIVVSRALQKTLAMLIGKIQSVLRKDQT